MDILVYFVIALVIIGIFFFSKSTFQENIPRVVHKIFINSTMEPVPIEDNIQRALDTWKNYNVKIWYGNDCKEYLIKHFGQEHLDCFNSLIPYAYKADFMRYCIVYNEGGFYSDWQQVLVGSLDPYLRYSWVSCYDTTGEENKNYKCMQNGFFGCPKGNSILKECISQILLNCKNKVYGKNPWYPTGPCLLGDVFRKVNLSNTKTGYTVNDPKDGPCFILDSKKIIINKCCSDINVPASNFKNGNNYLYLWKEQNVYK